MYNIYLNSPQLAYNQNIKKYYKYIIQKNTKIQNINENQKLKKKYPPSYYLTSYNSIYNPNQIIIPY